MKPLDGARLKIVRAQKHLGCLKADIRSYLESKPYAIEAWRQGRIIHLGGTTITKPPPLDIGCIFGDCLNNLRSSLDYIAWELATKHTPAATLVDQGSSLHFPLHKNAQHFATNARPKLKNLSFPADVIDEIERVQPYQAGYDPLDVLNNLIKTDKHRLPLLTIATATTDSVVVNERGLTVTLEFSDTPFDEGKPAKMLPPGSPEAARLLQELQSEASSPGSSGEHAAGVDVDGQVKVFVSLKDFPMPNEPVDVTLSKIFKCVSDIIPRFDSFLP